MSFFNISFFNASTFLTRLYEVPTPSAYSNIKVFGECTVGTVYGERRILTDTQISNYNPKVEQTWGTHTYINAKFDNNLQAGNIVSLPASIDGWIVQRKSSTESKFTTLANVSASTIAYVDKLVKSKTTYIYQLIPKAGSFLGAPLQSDPTTTDFKKVILMNPLTEEGYSFCLEIQFDALTTNEDVVTSDTKGKYPTVLKGNRRYKTSSIGVIAVSDADTANGIQQDEAFINQLESFIFSDVEKIIKYPKGLTYRVQTNNFVATKLEGLDNQGNTVYSLAFEWTEIGDL